MPFVLDASVALAWHFADEGSDYTERALEHAKTDEVIVPAVWPLEVANGLIIAERRGRVTQARVAEVHSMMADLDITVQPITFETAISRVMALASTYGLSAYDAAYLDVAMQEGIFLATQDQKLLAAATAAGVEIME